MLYLIKGRAGSGKTAYLRNLVKATAEKEDSKPLVIIPKQFSFETERAMLKFLGPKTLKKVDIFSLSRLALTVLKESGVATDRLPDNGIRTAIMSEALCGLQGRLSIFNKYKANKTSLQPLVEICKELKYCRIDSDELLCKTALLKDGFLKDKLTEINLISKAYDSIVTQSYFDDTQAVHLLTLECEKNGYFKNKTVFIDGFRSFSMQELECLGVAFSQADNVYITLCSDENTKKLSPFYFTSRVEKQLRSIAAKNNVVVKEILCQQKNDAFKSGIFSLEKNLFSDNKLDKVKDDNSVIITKCLNKDDECIYVAKTIKKLLREGKYRCRDIAVIERTEGSYKTKLIDELHKLSVPVFDDSKHSLVFEPLFIYIKAVMECISNGITTESIFTILKTGFSDLSVNEISRLEKYALIWGINGKAWLKDFTMHPDGFGNEINDDVKEKINVLNEFRKKAVLPIIKLKKDCDNKNCKEITENLYNFLLTQRIDDRLFDLYSELIKSGFPVEARRQEITWESLMHIFDTMVSLYGEKPIKLARYFEIFNILVDSGDIGEIPQGLDEVIIGSADRIRTEKIKVAFLVGVNKEEFPLVSVKSGVLTNSDRASLTALGLEISPPFEETIYEERFICYCAVTAATEKLYLTYKSNCDDGAQAVRSDIIETALSSIDGIILNDSTESKELDSIECEENAFTVLAKNFNNNNTIKATLLKYFENNPAYEGKVLALNSFKDNKSVQFQNEENSKKLFGKDIYLSASKVENFYNCPFAYFVRYGLRAEPLHTAELDPSQSGTIIHLIMEKILGKYQGDSFLNVSEEELRLAITEILKEYLENNMSGKAEKTKRFLFLFNRLVDISLTIIQRLKDEFKSSDFVPCDFELDIGGENKPYYTIKLNEGVAKINGSIDRVDIMEKDGIKYVRVIDYKTGKKEFKLCKLLDGLNIQMVLYLMALEKNKEAYYGDILPAGVLYLPSRIGIDNYLDIRNPSDEDVALQKNISGKLSGMVLASPVVFNGMGVDKNPGYFPVGYKKDDSYKGNFYSIKDFNNLSKIIDKKIIDMGNALHKGKISPVPSGKDDKGDMCSYCSYKSVCSYEYGDKIRETTNLSHVKTLERLEGEANEERVD